MDIYSTSFCLPRPSSHNVISFHSPPPNNSHQEALSPTSPSLDVSNSSNTTRAKSLSSVGESSINDTVTTGHNLKARTSGSLGGERVALSATGGGERGGGVGGHHHSQSLSFSPTSPSTGFSNQHSHTGSIGSIGISTNPNPSSRSSVGVSIIGSPASISTELSTSAGTNGGTGGASSLPNEGASGSLLSPSTSSSTSLSKANGFGTGSTFGPPGAGVGVGGGSKRLSGGSISAVSLSEAAGAGAGVDPIHQAIKKLCEDTMVLFPCFVEYSLVEASTNGSGNGSGSGSTGGNVAGKGEMYHFLVSGGYQAVMSAKGSILRDNPFKRKSTVKVPRAEVLDSTSSVKLEMRRKLDEIASLTKAHLAIVGQVSGNIGFGLETERNVEIVIEGGFESVEQARVRLLVLLDELSGLHSEVCEIDYKLHHIISGRKRCVVQTIQEETGTNIYFPTPLSGVFGTNNSSLVGKQNLIFITGEFFGVQRARDMLFQVSLHKSKCIISRDTAILPRKLDWILSDRMEEIKQIMNDNGTFLNFPPVGSQASLISIYGDHRVNIERTIRAVMQLACQFYVASFWLLPISFDVFMPPPTINPAQIPPILKHIATSSGAEVVFKSNCFELHGLEAEVRNAVGLVLELDLVKAFHHEIRFQIELANEHREFISGKKNGKLNKIMKSANVKIKFETFNDYNFLIDVAGSDTGALYGLTMLQEELPAEISFHVPEAYHKRIIGVAGKNIQRIMKKYGVYVKFSNAEEFAALGGYTDNEDNVIARTPAKNGINLEHLKQSVMELVSPKDKDFVVETVSIPRRYHRTLLGEKSIFIHDIESKTNSAVRFPNKETASDIVAIFGPESQVHIAAQMLLDHVPFEAEYRLPHHSEMASLSLSQDFLALTERVKRDLNITLVPSVDRTGAGEETVIRFCLNRSNVDYLATARDLVQEFLVARNIPLYPGSVRPTADPFSDAFPFFNSKLLSTPAETESRPELRSDRKLRLAASSPNIKALFDANPPSYGHRPPSGEQQDFSSFYPPPVPPIPLQHQQPLSPSLHHQPSLQLLQRSPFGGNQSLTSPKQQDYHWAAPRPITYAGASSYNNSTATSFAPSPNVNPARLSHDEATLLQGRSAEETQRKPRTMANRAQSLDITRHHHHSLSRDHEHEIPVQNMSEILSQLDL